MSYQQERDEFVAEATRAGLRTDTIRLLLRYATTLQRLAVAQCNGDYPADNGERKVQTCLRCEGGFVPSSFRRVSVTQDSKGRKVYRRVCPDCYAQHRVTEILKADHSTSYFPEFGGDPRGAVLRLYPVGTVREDIDSGRARGIYVPPSSR